MRVLLLAACVFTASAFVAQPGTVLRQRQATACSQFTSNAFRPAVSSSLRTASLLNSRRSASLAGATMAAANAGPMTLFDKIWRDHVVDVQSDGTTLLYIDRHLVHEVTSPQAFEGLRTAGRKARRPECTLATVDHNVPTTDRSMFESVSTFIKEVESQTQVPDCRSRTSCFERCVYCSGSGWKLRCWRPAWHFLLNACWRLIGV